MSALEPDNNGYAQDDATQNNGIWHLIGNNYYSRLLWQTTKKNNQQGLVEDG